MNLYVHYGCGFTAPEGWINFDASPTLRLERIPVLGRFVKKNTQRFPENVQFGDITKGLPGIVNSSCRGIYCSHVLEHLSLFDFRTALKNTFNYLSKDGVFRCVLPDLEYNIKNYSENINKGVPNASIIFLESTMLGTKNRPRGFKGLLQIHLGNSHHLWMWDKYSLQHELEQAGFNYVRQCSYGDATDNMFKLVEEKNRFAGAIAFEAIK